MFCLCFIREKLRLSSNDCQRASRIPQASRLRGISSTAVYQRSDVVSLMVAMYTSSQKNRRLEASQVTVKPDAFRAMFN